MKHFLTIKIRGTIILSTFLFLSISNVNSQCIPSASLNGWTTQGIVSLVSSASGTDYYGMFPLGSPASGFAIKVGDKSTYPQPFSSATYSFMVSPSEPFLQYYYAMVNLDYPHSTSQAATSQIIVRDINGNILPCGQFQVFAQVNGPVGFLPSSRPPESNHGGEPGISISYLPWQTSIIDLRPFIGTTITIELTNDWCFYGVDWGYAYFDARCVNFEIAKTCLSGGQYLLSASQGGLSYLWNTGATTSTIQVSSPGTYSCLVSLVQGSSCSISLNYNFSSSGTTFTTNSNKLCMGQAVTFTPSNSGSQSALTYLWDFGDGNTSNLITPQHYYQFPGLYTVKLITTYPASGGCTDSASMQITVEENPNGNFTVDDHCLGEPAPLTNISNAPAGQNLFFNWDLGDLTSSAAFQPNHYYSQPGNYMVKLVTTNSSGCSDSLTKNIRVYAIPVPDMIPFDVKCLQKEIKLYDNSSVSDGTIISWNWAIANNQPHTSQNPIFMLNSAGVFDILLEVTSSNGCKADSLFMDAMEILPLPAAAFAFSPQQPDIFFPKVFFRNNSSNNIKNFWNFGDGSTSTEENPIHEFIEVGEYKITLIVETDFGCSDTMTRQLKLRNNSSFWAPNAFSPNNDLTNDVFSPKAINISDYTLKIYDRWGNLVFQSIDLNIGWDGSKNNQPAPEDVYIFHATYNDHAGMSKQCTDRITLVR